MDLDYRPIWPYAAALLPAAAGSAEILATAAAGTAMAPLTVPASPAGPG